MRLLAVELTRLRWRRAVFILLAGCVIVPTLLWAGLAWGTRPVSEAEIQQAKDIVAQNTEVNQQSIDECMANPQNYGVPPGEDPAQLCAEFMGGG